VGSQPAGKLIFTREHALLSGEPTGPKVVRLNRDGSLDNRVVHALDASQPSSALTCMSIEGDGSLVLGGYTLEVNEFGSLSPRSLLVRLSANGALDNTFTNDNGAFGGRIACLTIQPDGRILIGGSVVTSVNG